MVRAAVIILTLGLAASVLLQATLCKSLGSIVPAWSFSAVSSLNIHTLSFLLSSCVSHLWPFQLSHFSSFQE